MDKQIAGELVDSVRAIAHGTPSGPTGLELVSIALAENGQDSVSVSIGRLASAMERIADSFEEIAAAITKE